MIWYIILVGLLVAETELIMRYLIIETHNRELSHNVVSHNETCHNSHLIIVTFDVIVISEYCHTSILSYY